VPGGLHHEILPGKGGCLATDEIFAEHNWDQASVLVQVGLLDPTGLPVSGPESARNVLDPKLPPRQM
jgi:carboxymethylenebutenolidase